MSRDLCSFNTYMVGKLYCDYFDFGCFECCDLTRCPAGLDEDEEGDENE